MKSTTSIADLQAQNTQQNKRISELESTVAELSALLEHFNELFKLAQHKRFGVSGEQNANQLTIFDGEMTESPPIIEPETEIIKYTRRKPGKRQEDLSKLPLEVVEHKLSDEERECIICGKTMKLIGFDTRSELKIIPAQVIHVLHKTEVCKCDVCVEKTGQTLIVKAELPVPAIPGSVASPSAIAFSVIETAKENGLKPFEYLQYLFETPGEYYHESD